MTLPRARDGRSSPEDHQGARDERHAVRVAGIASTHSAGHAWTLAGLRMWVWVCAGDLVQVYVGVPDDGVVGLLAEHVDAAAQAEPGELEARPRTDPGCRALPVRVLNPMDSTCAKMLGSTPRPLSTKAISSMERRLVAPSNGSAPGSGWPPLRWSCRSAHRRPRWGGRTRSRASTAARCRSG